MGWLAFNRKTKDSVVCTLPNGERIVFKIGRIQQSRVKVAIQAPQSVAIDRGEVRDEKDWEESRRAQ